VARAIRSEAGVVTVLLGGSTLWGLYWLPLRLLEQGGLGGLWVVVLVYVGASGVLLWLARRELRALPGFAAPMLGVGLSGAVSGIAFSVGVIEGEVARVLILFYLAPVWSVLLARWVLREPLAPVTIPALLVALGGAAMMLLSDGGLAGSRLALAELLGLIAGLAFALTNVQLRAARALSPRLKNLAACYLVPPLAVVVAVALDLPLAAPAVTLVGSLVLGMVWMSAMIAMVQYGVSHLPLQQSSVLLLFELIVGAVSAALIAGERLGPWELIGGVCIAAAGLAVVWGRRTAARADPPGLSQPRRDRHERGGDGATRAGGTSASSDSGCRGQDPGA